MSKQTKKLPLAEFKQALGIPEDASAITVHVFITGAEITFEAPAEIEAAPAPVEAPAPPPAPPAPPAPTNIPFGQKGSSDSDGG